MTYEIRGYCAGILVFEEFVLEEDLENLLGNKKQELKHNGLTIQFGSEQRQVVTELCIDVYDVGTGKWLPKLGVTYKQ